MRWSSEECLTCLTCSQVAPVHSVRGCEEHAFVLPGPCLHADEHMQPCSLCVTLQLLLTLASEAFQIVFAHLCCRHASQQPHRSHFCRCTLAPAEKLYLWELVGDPGKRNGGKLLREKIIALPQWTDREMRHRTVRRNEFAQFGGSYSPDESLCPDRHKPHSSLDTPGSRRPSRKPEAAAL